MVKYMMARIKPKTLAALKIMLLTESLYLPVTKGAIAPYAISNTKIAIAAGLSEPVSKVVAWSSKMVSLPLMLTGTKNRKMPMPLKNRIFKMVKSSFGAGCAGALFCTGVVLGFMLDSFVLYICLMLSIQ